MSARKRPPIPGKLDRGIARAVRILQARGIETFESCEGGEGHAYTEPTVAFNGGPEAGWRALSVCLTYGLPVFSLRRVWHVLDFEPDGPKWEITFWKMTDEITSRTPLPSDVDPTRGLGK